MGRLIDINPVISNLTAMKSMYDAIALDGMIKGLEDAPTVDAADVMRGMWISVKERLPDENENCLFISSANNSVYIGRYICTGKKGAVKFEKRDGRGTVLYTASHWMLLPEPPEEDKP